MTNQFPFKNNNFFSNTNQSKQMFYLAFPQPVINQVNNIQQTSNNNPNGLSFRNTVDISNFIKSEGSSKIKREYTKFTVPEHDPMKNVMINLSFTSITAIDGYRDYSIEELRRIDYVYKKSKVYSGGMPFPINNLQVN